MDGIRATVGILLLKRTEMNRSTTLVSLLSDRIRWAVAHILYVMQRWQGVARIYNRSWENRQADVITYCDIALENEPAKAGSFGKGAFSLPSEKWFSTQWTEDELREAMREEKHSSAHLELINMLEAVLFFASETQRVLCICDSKASVRIATARYSAAANRRMEQRLNEFDLECCKRDLSVRFKWAPRTGEPQAVVDSLSRGEVPVP